MRIRSKKHNVNDLCIDTANDFIHKYNLSETLISSGDKLKKIKKRKDEISTVSKNGKIKITFLFNATGDIIDTLLFSTAYSDYNVGIRINRSIIFGLGLNLYDAVTFVSAKTWNFGDYILEYDYDGALKGTVKRVK